MSPPGSLADEVIIVRWGQVRRHPSLPAFSPPIGSIEVILLSAPRCPQSSNSLIRELQGKRERLPTLLYVGLERARAKNHRPLMEDILCMTPPITSTVWCAKDLFS